MPERLADVAGLRVDRRLPRAVHPGAWWVWALGLSTVASRTTNPLVLVLVLGVLTVVVTARRTDAPWARSFGVFLRIALVVLAVRTLAQVVLGTPTTGRVLFTLPQVDLPTWAAGVSLGGPVTAPALAAAVIEGLRLATMLACMGAANTLANPKRLLASLPGALHEVGVAVVVALSFAPSIAGSVARIRSARRLRGHPDRGLRGMTSVALPVLEDALERSLSLAAAMDARGYGRRSTVAPGQRRLTAVLLLGGLLGVALGLYGLLDGRGTGWGLALTLVGASIASVGLVVASRRVTRTRYRPDPWRAAEWVATGTGCLAVLASIVTGAIQPAGLYPDPLPLAALTLPPVVTVGILAALLPAWLTPPPPSPALGVTRERSAAPLVAEVPA